MTKTQDFEKKTKELIDCLKSACANYGLGKIATCKFANCQLPVVN